MCCKRLVNKSASFQLFNISLHFQEEGGQVSSWLHSLCPGTHGGCSPQHWQGTPTLGRHSCPRSPGLLSPHQLRSQDLSFHERGSSSVCCVWSMQVRLTGICGT